MTDGSRAMAINPVRRGRFLNFNFGERRVLRGGARITFDGKKLEYDGRGTFKAFAVPVEDNGVSGLVLYTRRITNDGTYSIIYLVGTNGRPVKDYAIPAGYMSRHARVGDRNLCWWRRSDLSALCDSAGMNLEEIDWRPRHPANPLMANMTRMRSDAWINALFAVGMVAWLVIPLLLSAWILASLVASVICVAAWSVTYESYLRSLRRGDQDQTPRGLAVEPED